MQFRCCSNFSGSAVNLAFASSGRLAMFTLSAKQVGVLQLTGDGRYMVPMVGLLSPPRSSLSRRGVANRRREVNGAYGWLALPAAFQ